jgi:hypothetical protein
MNPRVEKALLEYRSLLELERETGTKTTRARNDVLRRLTDSDLTAFAVKLKGTELTHEPTTK